MDHFRHKGLVSLGKANSREVFYISTMLTMNWAELLPADCWIVVPIADKKNSILMQEVANICLDRNVDLVCASGKECEWVHDWFDETIVDREIDAASFDEDIDEFEFNPMTTWHSNFTEALWFALFITESDDKDLDKIIILDMTDKYYMDKLKNLISKINEGWQPEK